MPGRNVAAAAAAAAAALAGMHLPLPVHLHLHPHLHPQLHPALARRAWGTLRHPCTARALMIHYLKVDMDTDST
jgi:hypothetical protein